MADQNSSYVVLARKYRPESFETFIGQEAMVQTLKNAFEANRIAHAFMLTGVRGVGKTTTARILARALNFEDDNGPRPNLELAEEGKHCRAIIESRHVDVVEMDAASHTGIDDIREIIDSVRYGPVSAPYKVFIIDEVHMLSKAAFNGLLKTLEEPPPYVKFIFATTEIRKVPVTILSRCQRFDLRRVESGTLNTYLTSILEKEGIAFQPDALQMIIRAGEGSVRDSLSLLDQAIAHAGGEIGTDTVKQMLGLADRALVLDLFETLMRGDMAGAFEQLRHQYDSGADPQTIMSDLATVTHLVTRLKVVPSAVDDPALTPDEKERGREMAQKLSVKILSRAWQILNKGISEINNSHDALQAAEMVLIRLGYAADLPSPDELIKKIQANPQGASAPQHSGGNGADAPRAMANGGGINALGQKAPTASRDQSPLRAMATNPDPTPAAAQEPTLEIKTYEELIQLAGENRELVLKHALEAHASPVSFATGRIELALTEEADHTFVPLLSAKLREWTNQTWMVSVAREKAGDTIAAQKQRARDARQKKAEQIPEVKAVLDAFPGAKLVNIRSLIDEDQPEDWLDIDLENEEGDL
ncbi:DNA-directed DNA polymerase [Maritalea myrionectae]|uniref:DNA polymerase III subunit gamma/tau n=1 Tax=Maritalea myrionectae TaxID=454601 RepID=A0A2R4MHV0_9HYPH|nr:DNA polymerase III subunit gamma/tau [Maritalea myrionectae]AVX05605.1 DNA-directed DNA polymerase [Maritalea myrionectae]